MAFLLQWLGDFATWLWNAITLVPLIWLNDFLGAVVTFLDGIPAPAFFADVANYIGNIPPLAAFLVSSLQIPAGVTIVCTCMVIRFLIRRLPFIG